MVPLDAFIRYSIFDGENGPPCGPENAMLLDGVTINDGSDCSASFGATPACNRAISDPTGMKDWMVSAGTKYEAMPLWSILFTNLRLRIPSKHFFSGSNTPEPDFPSVAPSLINVKNFVRYSGEITAGDAMLLRVISCGAARMTGAPAGSCSRQSAILRSRKLSGIFPWSI